MKTHPGNYLALALAVLALNLSAIQPAQAASWVTNSPMTTPRESHTVTLLPNGKVLVTGGYGSNLISSLTNSEELYDPATGKWTPTGSMNAARGDHTATLLQNGKVLVAGGANDSGALFSAELYDPATGTWTNTGELNVARDHHTATLLANGKVLVVGGSGRSFPYELSSTELYDPATGLWTTNDPLNVARSEHTATLLPNGKVLVAGGYNGYPSIYLSSAELFDPVKMTWTPTGDMNTGRRYHT
jgi:N-acetylneuraminic acid mutarotase